MFQNLDIESILKVPWYENVYFNTVLTKLWSKTNSTYDSRSFISFIEYSFVDIKKHNSNNTPDPGSSMNCNESVSLMSFIWIGK